MVDRRLFGCRYIFVISGYLITSLLLKEYEETGIINLKEFLVTSIKASSTSSISFIISSRYSHITIQI